MLLESVDWQVEAGEHWALLGPNGAGKSTLLSLAGAVRHPSTGLVRVLGSELGKVDLRELRRRIGLVDARSSTPGYLEAELVVCTGFTGATQAWWDRYDDAQLAEAHRLLELAGCGHLAGRAFGTLSQGEQARVRIARALAARPDLLLLDEPATGLDLPGREDLIDLCSAIATQRPEVATVTVAHGLEELPETINRAMLLRAGRVVAAGAVETVLTSENLSACYDRPLEVARSGGRYHARGVRETAAG